MKNVAEKIKFWCLDTPRAIIWLIRIKKIDPNAEDETFFEWFERFAKKEGKEREVYTNLLFDIYINTKVNNYRKKLFNKIIKFGL